MEICSVRTLTIQCPWMVPRTMRTDNDLTMKNDKPTKSQSTMTQRKRNKQERRLLTTGVEQSDKYWKDTEFNQAS